MGMEEDIDMGMEEGNIFHLCSRMMEKIPSSKCPLDGVVAKEEVSASMLVWFLPFLELIVLLLPPTLPSEAELECPLDFIDTASKVLSKLPVMETVGEERSLSDGLEFSITVSWLDDGDWVPSGVSSELKGLIRFALIFFDPEPVL
jgi:hypothetical protein